VGLFKSKPESPAELEAEQTLDEATRSVGWDEFEKEGEREREFPLRGFFGPLTFFGRFRRKQFHHVAGDAVPEPVDDPDAGDEQGLRDAFRPKAAD
jgi:hypothetical protein